MKTTGLGASLKPLTTSTACSVNTFTELRPMLASTLSFWEPPHYPFGSGRYQESLKNLGIDPQKVTKLALKLHAHSVQYTYKLVSTRRALEKTFAANHYEDHEWGIACGGGVIRCLGFR